MLIVGGAVGWPSTARTHTAIASTDTLLFGDTPVRLLVDDRPPPGVTYVHLHENETTAAEAAAHVVRSRGGRFVRLRAQGARLVTFETGGHRYTCDPNRIFTPAGISRTLRHHGRDTPRAREAVNAFAQRVLHAIMTPVPVLIIAVHNNQNYSLRSYVQGGPLARDAARVHAGGVDPATFCLVTDDAVFDALKTHDVNVVLQDPARVDDDGSLAVYCQRHRLRYVNVEARHGHLAQQVALLDLVRRVAA